MKLNRKPFPILSTERMILREITLKDAPSLYKLFTDDDNVRVFGYRIDGGLDEAEHIIERWTEAYEKESGYRWGIVLKETGELIGNIGLRNMAKEHYRTEIGYIIDKKYWRQGLMYEALQPVIRFGFDEIGFNRIDATAFTENEASRGLLEKMNFKMEGVLRKSYYFDGNFFDTYIYSLIKGEDYKNTK